MSDEYNHRSSFEVYPEHRPERSEGSSEGPSEKLQPEAKLQASAHCPIQEDIESETRIVQDHSSGVIRSFRRIRLLMKSCSKCPHERDCIFIQSFNEIVQQAIQEIADEKPLEVFDEAGNRRYDSGSISYNKLRMEARKWLAAKYLPRVYGDRQILAGDAENPVEIKQDASVFEAILQNLELQKQAKK